MADPRIERLRAAVSALERPVRWVGRLATFGSVVGAVSGGLVWWAVAAGRAGDGGSGAVGAVLALVLLLLPAAWLLNVRAALASLVGLPARLDDIARRRGPQLRHARIERPRGGALAAVRSVRGVVADYGDVVGSWGLVAQLASPLFWLLTVVALAAVAVLAVLAAVLGLVRLVA